MIKVTFLSHALEAQQCAQGLAGARTGMQEQIMPGGVGIVEAGPQQLDQLPLPGPWLQSGSLWPLPGFPGSKQLK
jgi:hypothetical protein